MRWALPCVIVLVGCGGDDAGAPVTDVDASIDALVSDGGSDASDSPFDAPGDVTAETTPVPTADVHFIGRFDRTDTAGPRFGWPGTGIVTRFNGTGIDVKLKSTDQFAVVVDGAVTLVKATSGQTTYTLA